MALTSASKPPVAKQAGFVFVHGSCMALGAGLRSLASLNIKVTLVLPLIYRALV